MISPYYGSFLVSPIPLEISLNACSHGCRFCFALLNQPHRRTNIKTVMNQLQTYQDKNTLEARLMREGYPVLMSNRVDPFAMSNFQQSLPLMESLTELGIPMTFQTRGGKGVDEALEFLQPAVWYISVNTQDDVLRKQLEPGAPDMDSRWRLMETLKQKGHDVVLGLNPYVPEWMPDPEAILTRAKDCGAEGVWIELLHFNTGQKAALGAKAYAAIGEEVIQRTAKKVIYDEEWDQFMDVRAMVGYCGMEVFSSTQGNPSAFLDTWKRHYPKLFPTWQDMINLCVEKQFEPTDFLGFQEVWDKLFASQLPGGIIPGLRGYVASKNRDVLYDGKFLAGDMTYKHLVNTFWEDTRLLGNPARSWGFSYPIAEENGEHVSLTSEDGIPWLCYEDGFYDEVRVVVPD